MMTWKLSKEFRFEASHQLMEHDGKCRQLHGHSWRGVLAVRGASLQTVGPKRNMLIDYSQIGDTMREFVEELDHHHLNDVLSTDMPTSEYLAYWLFNRVVVRIARYPEVRLDSIRIEETCTTACEYSEAL